MQRQWITGAVLVAFLFAGSGCGDAIKKALAPSLETPSGIIVMDEGDGEVTLNWQILTSVAAGSSTTFTVYYDTAPNVSKSAAGKVSGISTNTKTITGLTNGTTYYFRVSAVNSVAGESGLSPEVSATPQATGPTSPPSAPTSVTATAGDGEVAVSWSAVSGATSYTVYYSGSPGVTSASLKSTGLATTAKTISALTNGTAYYFRVSASNSLGEGALSAEKSATPAAVATVPTAPTGVAANAADGQVTVTWASVSGAVSYTVYYGVTAGVTKASPSKSVGITTTSKAISSLSNGTTYFFAVSATNANGESDLSSEESATPFQPSGQWTTGPTFGTSGAYNHTATTLDNGKVLILGGTARSSPTATRQSKSSYFVYDPQAKTFTSAKQLTVGATTYAREKHSATLLNNGQVLVVGGARRDATANNITNHDDAIKGEAFLYEPAIDAWNTTGGLSTHRFGHQALRNAADQVLIIGGFAEDAVSFVSNESTTSVGFYDSQGTSVSTTGSLATARWRHTATLLDNNKALVVGGLSDPGGISGALNATPLKSAELLTMGTGLWSNTASLFQERFGHTATKLSDGRVLVAGGFGTTGAALNSYQIYNPTTGQWSTTKTMQAARGDHIAVLLGNGKVLVAGGATTHDLTAGDFINTPQASAILKTAELYDPTGDTWTTTGSLTVARWRATATVLADGTVLVVGGWSGTKSENTTEIYKP